MALVGVIGSIGVSINAAIIILTALQQNPGAMKGSTYAVRTAMARFGTPKYIRSDNGSEFIAKKVQKALKKRSIKTLYIDPGSPWQNGYIESFHSRFRDECLVREWLLNLREARVVVEDWRRWYNEERPHSRLGYLSPEAFLKQRRLTP